MPWPNHFVRLFSSLHLPDSNSLPDATYSIGCLCSSPLFTPLSGWGRPHRDQGFVNNIVLREYRLKTMFYSILYSVEEKALVFAMFLQHRVRKLSETLVFTLHFFLRVPSVFSTWE